MVHSITPKEREILYLLTKEFLTVKKIAQRRKTSVQAIYKAIKKLREKGFLGVKNMEGLKSDVYFKPFKSVSVKKNTPISTGNHKIRLHRQQFNIKILYKKNDYYIRSGKTLKIDNNTIKLNKHTIDIYSNTDFIGDTAEEAYKQSIEYWFSLFHRLEHRLNIILVKDGYQNIREVQSHYAEVNNELAQDYNKNDHKLRIKGKDGKTWLLVDNSFNLNELETIHPETAKEDMTKIKTFFDDIRDHETPTISEILSVIKGIAEQNKETAAGLNAVVTLLKPAEPNLKEHINNPADYIG